MVIITQTAMKPIIAFIFHLIRKTDFQVSRFGDKYPRNGEKNKVDNPKHCFENQQHFEETRSPT